MAIVGVGIDVVDIEPLRGVARAHPGAARAALHRRPRRPRRSPRWPRGSPPRRRWPRRSAPRRAGLARRRDRVGGLRATALRDAAAPSPRGPTRWERRRSTSRSPTTPASPPPSWSWRAEPGCRPGNCGRRVAACAGPHGRAGPDRRGGPDGGAARRRADGAGGRRARRVGRRPARVGVRPPGAAARRCRRQRRRRAVCRRPAAHGAGARSRRCCWLPTRRTRTAWRRCAAPVAESVDAWPTASPSRPRGRRHRRDRRPRAGCGPTPRPRWPRFEGVPVVAVDVPSGVDVDTGELDGPARGGGRDRHLRHPQGRPPGRPGGACLRRGRTWSTSGSTLPSAAVEALQADDVAALLPRPAPAAHKYSRGVVGRARRVAQYPGAALLAVAGASCGLVGMVRYVGRAVADDVRARASGGRRRRAGCRRGSSGPAEATTRRRRCSECLADGVPVVVDADALAARAGRARVARGPDPPRRRAGRGCSDVDRDGVEAAPLRHARDAAWRFDSVVLLKGRRTLVAEPVGAGPRQRDRRALAGHRRRRRRARRARRGAARRRARGRSTRRPSEPGCTARRRTSRAAGGPLVAGDVARRSAGRDRRPARLTRRA